MLGPPPESVLIGETELGPIEEGRTITSGEDLRAWLAADDGDPHAVITIAPSSDPAVLAQLGLQPRRHFALAAGPFAVVAHFQGEPMAVASLRAPTPARPVTIGGHHDADLDVSVGHSPIRVFGGGGVLFAEFVNGCTTTVRLDYGKCVEFGDTVLHFVPDDPLPDSFYRPNGTDCNDMLPLSEFKAEVARLVAVLSAET